MSDWDDFRNDRWWSPKLHAAAEVLTKDVAETWVAPSEVFVATFPVLTELLG